jgi:DNA (cytosine-5)-methyltransferase 1
LEPRAGTVRELARLQTFPNHYVFRGPFNAPNNSKFEFQYRQVGNSVTVVLAKSIGKQIVSNLKVGICGDGTVSNYNNRKQIAPMVR